MLQRVRFSIMNQRGKLRPQSRAFSPYAEYLLGNVSSVHPFAALDMLRLHAYRLLRSEEALPPMSISNMKHGAPA